MTAKEAWNEKSIPTRRPLMLYGACAPKNSKPGIKKRECEKLMRQHNNHTVFDPIWKLRGEEEEEEEEGIELAALSEGWNNHTFS